MRKRRRCLAAGVVSVATLVACTFSRTLGEGDEVESGPCTVVPSATCADAVTLRVCSTVGELPTPVPCSWGCKPADGDHCGVLVPAGGGATAEDTRPAGLADLADIVLDAPATIDGGAGTITGVTAGFAFEARAGGTIAVFRMKSLTINSAVKLAGPAAIAIVTDGPIVVTGTIDAKGACGINDAATGPGPGGLAGAAGSGASATGPGGGSGALGSAGAGGGGHGTPGGSGGAGPAVTGGAGGSIAGKAIIEVLVGGGGGGASDGGGGRGRGGGGGGAVQLASNTKITLSGGGIDAGGCAGDSGQGAGPDGGGGGGAGGTILLEAPVIEGDGKLAVNGGGGGAGDDAMDATGSQTTLSRTPALGARAVTDGRAGGAGAAGATTASKGEDATNHAGGGGGGAGRIRLNTRTGDVAATGEMSPSLTDPNSTCTAGSANVQ